MDINNFANLYENIEKLTYPNGIVVDRTLQKAQAKISKIKLHLDSLNQVDKQIQKLS